MKRDYAGVRSFNILHFLNKQRMMDMVHCYVPNLLFEVSADLCGQIAHSGSFEGVLLMKATLRLLPVLR